MVAALASSSRIAPSSQTMDASFLSPPLHSTADSSSNHSNRFSSNTDFPLSIMAGIVSSRHGIRQIRNGWADGPAYITQCPIQTGQSYVYNYTIVGQRGTLFWHAHISWLRATVYGALIILPKHLSSYPFPKPYKDVPLIFGEWFNGDIEAMINQATLTGGGPDVSDA